jgi:hypothetical protein
MYTYFQLEHNISHFLFIQCKLECGCRLIKEQQDDDTPVVACLKNKKFHDLSQIRTRIYKSRSAKPGYIAI